MQSILEYQQIYLQIYLEDTHRFRGAMGGPTPYEPLAAVSRPPEPGYNQLWSIPLGAMGTIGGTCPGLWVPWGVGPRPQGPWPPLGEYTRERLA
jgi:hypothetical protein